MLLATCLVATACGDNGTEPPLAELDQQNLLDGTLGGSAIGIFVESGSTAGEHQNAQVFTVGITGTLASVRVPLIDANEVATAGATVEIVRTSNGVPDDLQKLGEVSVPLSGIPGPPGSAIRADPALWVVFDFSQLSIPVTAGEQLAFIARSYTAGGIIYNSEFTMLYTQGSAYRRNRLQGLTWTHAVGASWGFQTWVYRDN